MPNFTVKKAHWASTSEGKRQRFTTGDTRLIDDPGEIERLTYWGIVEETADVERKVQTRRVPGTGEGATGTGDSDGEED